MRKSIILGASLAVLLTPVLAACGEGSSFDTEFKKSYRDKMVTSCVSSAKGSIPAGIKIDLEGICGCTADKVMEGKTAKDLMTQTPGGAEDMAKLQQCMKQFAPGMGVGMGAGAAGSAPADAAAPVTK